MKAGPPDNPPQDMRWDENDPVWHLLGRAPRPEPDAWFTARTLARCRYEGSGIEAGRVSLVRIWRWALGGGLAVSMALALVVAQFPSEKVDKEKNVQEAFQILASVDMDPDSSPSPSWQDSSL